jgi:hypothetical protein
MLKILSYKYKLQLSKLDNEFGNVDNRKQIINIDSSLCDQAKTSTILHEIIEALNFHLALNLQHEQIVTLESGLFSTLTDNGCDLNPLLKNSDKQ